MIILRRQSWSACMQNIASATTARARKLNKLFTIFLVDFEYPAPNDWLWDPSSFSSNFILALFLALDLIISAAFLVPLIGDTPVLIIYIVLVIASLYLILKNRKKYSRLVGKPKYKYASPARYRKPFEKSEFMLFVIILS